MRKFVFLALFGIFVLAYFLRVMFLPQLSLTFGYDQARDANVARQIISGDLKVLGPPASTPGLYHGVFYYYLLAPAYWIGAGSPIIAAYWIAFLNAATVFIVFSLTYLLTRRIGAGLLAAFLFAISWESTQYATWISNPTIGVWTVPLIYLGLWAWIKEKKNWGPFVAAAGLGLSIQANIFLAYHFWPVLIWVFWARKQIMFGDFLKFALTLAVVVSTMFISEAKFGFRGIIGIKNLLFREDALIGQKSLFDFGNIFLDQLGKVFTYSTMSEYTAYGKILVFLVLVLLILSWIKTKKREVLSWQLFLGTYMVAHSVAVPFGGSSTPFVAVGIGSGFSVVVAILIHQLWQKYKFFAFGLIILLVFLNTSKILSENYKGQTIFAIQKDMVLSKQLPAIDYTYKESNGEPFTINSLTSPLWINIVWTYLYQWYGFTRYEYIPEWHGRDQIGQLDTLPPTQASTARYFLILEPMQGIPQRYLGETIDEEDNYSRFIDEKNFGEIRVQKGVKI